MVDGKCSELFDIYRSQKTGLSIIKTEIMIDIYCFNDR